MNETHTIQDLWRVRWCRGLAAALLLSLLSVGPWLHAQGTAFTYQGRLMESNAPANGSFEFEFSLYNAATGGTNLGTLTLEETPVSNGLFTVLLDFGPGAFNGQPRWLEIYARNDGAGGIGVLLTPRQPITATPYAMVAGHAITAATATNLASLIASNQLADGAVIGAKIQNGSIVNAHISPTAAIADTKLGTIATAGKVANSATTATSLNSSNTIVLRNAAGGITAYQIVALGGFYGNGSDLTGLDADSIQYGTLDDARLSANVTRLGSTIEPNELSKPYRSGSISSVKPETAFGRMSYSVSFPQPFASTPNVTLGLSCSDFTALETLKVSVTEKSPTGFTATALMSVPPASTRDFYGLAEGSVSALSVHGVPGVFHAGRGTGTNTIRFHSLLPYQTNIFWQGIDLVTNTPAFNGMCGAMIQGRPALVYMDETAGSIRFIRATTTNGSAWGSPVTIVPVATAGAWPQLLEVGQRPAVAYLATNGHLRFVRANDAAGTSWGSGVTVESSYSSYPFLAVINGNPAVCYRGTLPLGLAGLLYRRATDANGTAWGPAVMVQADGPGASGYTVYQGYFPTMTTVNGRPAIAYQNGSDTIMVRSQYIRANDANGDSWGTLRQVSPHYVEFGRTILIVTDGRPAAVYPGGYSPMFTHAVDADGDTWMPPTNLDAEGGVNADNAYGFSQLSAVMVGGDPWVFFHSRTESSSIYLKSNRPVVPEFQIDWTAIDP